MRSAARSATAHRSTATSRCVSLPVTCSGGRPDLLGWFEEKGWLLISDVAGILRGLTTDLTPRHDHRRPAHHRDGLSALAHPVRAAPAVGRREAVRRRLARRVGASDALRRHDPLRGDGRLRRGRVGVRRRQPLPAGPDRGSGLPRSRRPRRSATGCRPARSPAPACSATPTASRLQHRRQQHGQGPVLAVGIALGAVRHVVGRTSARRPRR